MYGATRFLNDVTDRHFDTPRSTDHSEASLSFSRGMARLSNGINRINGRERASFSSSHLTFLFFFFFSFSRTYFPERNVTRRVHMSRWTCELQLWILIVRPASECTAFMFPLPFFVDSFLFEEFTVKFKEVIVPKLQV